MGGGGGGEETSCSIRLFKGYASRPRELNYADLLEMLFPGDLSSNVFLLFERMYFNSEVPP